MNPKQIRTARAWGIALAILHVAFFAVVYWVSRKEPIGMLIIPMVDFPIGLPFLWLGGTGNNYVDLTLLFILGTAMWYYIGYGATWIVYCFWKGSVDGQCRICNYDLTGNQSGRCRECGSII